MLTDNHLNDKHTVFPTTAPDSQTPNNTTRPQPSSRLVPPSTSVQTTGSQLLFLLTRSVSAYTSSKLENYSTTF